MVLKKTEETTRNRTVRNLKSRGSSNKQLVLHWPERQYTKTRHGAFKNQVLFLLLFIKDCVGGGHTMLTLA